MGAGKSYIGSRLAESFKMPFSDLDAVIEAGEEKSIADIFDEFGEAHFRALERKYLHNFSLSERHMIATGGGAPCFFDNMDWMNRHGVTIYLKTKPELLAQRLYAEKNHRPLLAQLDDQSLLAFIRDKIEERSEFYEQASVIVEQNTNDENIIEDLFKNFSSITGH